MSYNSGRHLGIVQNKPVDRENGQRVCFTQRRWELWGVTWGIMYPPLSLPSVQLAGSPNSCLHGGEHKVKAAALKALLSQLSIRLLQTVSLYPAVQQPSASTRQDSCSGDDKFVAVQDML